LLVATEEDLVYALDTRSGAVVWRRSLGSPAPLSRLHCGIAPLGVTGTPVIDAATRTLYLDAVVTPDGISRRHLIFALSVDDGTVRRGGRWTWRPWCRPGACASIPRCRTSAGGSC